MLGHLSRIYAYSLCTLQLIKFSKAQLQSAIYLHRSYLLLQAVKQGHWAPAMSWNLTLEFAAGIWIDICHLEGHFTQFLTKNLYQWLWLAGIRRMLRQKLPASCICTVIAANIRHPAFWKAYEKYRKKLLLLAQSFIILLLRRDCRYL